MVFDYSSLPRDFPRQYLSSKLKFDWEELSKVFDELEARELKSPADLTKWLLDQAELDAYIYEQRSLRYINSTRQTDDPEYTRPYEQYVEELEPKIKVANSEVSFPGTSTVWKTNAGRQQYPSSGRRMSTLRGRIPLSFRSMRGRLER
jgi:hypothetical protein